MIERHIVDPCIRGALDKGTVPQAARAPYGDNGLAAAKATGADMLAEFVGIVQPFVPHCEWASGRRPTRYSAKSASWKFAARLARG